MGWRLKKRFFFFFRLLNKAFGWSRDTLVFDCPNLSVIYTASIKDVNLLTARFT